MEQLFGAIPLVLSNLGQNAGVDEAVVFAAWGRSAGEMLRMRTSPVEFFENRLVVAVADETWRRHLEDLSPQMLVKLNGLLGQGTVKFIEFRVTVAINNPSKREEARPEADLKDTIDPSLVAAADRISDERLRKEFLSSAATYLSRQK